MAPSFFFSLPAYYSSSYISFIVLLCNWTGSKNKLRAVRSLQKGVTLQCQGLFFFFKLNSRLELSSLYLAWSHEPPCACALGGVLKDGRRRGGGVYNDSRQPSSL